MSRDFGTWQGFVKESKRYMNHPDYWPENGAAKYAPEGETGWTSADKRRAAIKFWLAFPRAWVRFNFFSLRDWIRRALR